MDFSGAAFGLPDARYCSFPARRVSRVDWLHEEQEGPAGLEFFAER